MIFQISYPGILKYIISDRKSFILKHLDIMKIRLHIIFSVIRIVRLYDVKKNKEHNGQL